MDNWQMRLVCHSERSRAQSAAKSKNPFHPAIGKETDPSAPLSGARPSRILFSNLPPTKINPHPLGGMWYGPEEIRLHFPDGKIKERIRRAESGGARPRRILLFESRPPRRNTTQRVVFLLGGPEEIRTPDPYNANVMRSQLRYRPMTGGERLDYTSG